MARPVLMVGGPRDGEVTEYAGGRIVVAIPSERVVRDVDPFRYERFEPFAVDFAYRNEMYLFDRADDGEELYVHEGLMARVRPDLFAAPRSVVRY